MMLRSVDYVGLKTLFLLACLFLFGCSQAPEETKTVAPKKNDSAKPDSIAKKLYSAAPGNTRELDGGFFESSEVQPIKSLPEPVDADPIRIEPLPRPKIVQPRAKFAQPRAMSAPPQAKVAQPRAMSAPPAFESGVPAQARNAQPAMVGNEPDMASASARPAAQTKMNVFYTTDRKSQSGIAAGDWFRVHFFALLVGIAYLVAFTAVFLSNRKVLYGTVAFGALIGFLFLGQSSTIKWQNLKRLQSNNDTIYLSKIRPSSSEPLDFGTCEVTIPPSHRKGIVDSPSILKLEFTENPEKHVVLQRVIRSSKDEFYDDMLDVMDRGRSRQALVFVHGYNVSFENAVKRTAQIAHDLQFDGAPICYSWSSHGAIANYTRDMANADATVVPLQNFLEELVERTGNSTIHLVAHSMGNRALLQALDRMAVSKPENAAVFGQLVMAAPDVSTHDFKNRFAHAAMRLANSVTLYASSRDRALIAATEIHGHNRAGLAGDNLIIIDGMDTIDVSEVDTSLIGHSYYGDHPELIKDLQTLVELARPASQREWLTRIINPGGFGYFRFANLKPETASGSDSQSDFR